MAKKSSYRAGKRLEMAVEKMPSVDVGSRHKDKRLVHEAEHMEVRRGKAGVDLMKLTAEQLRKKHMKKMGTDVGGCGSSYSE